MKKFIILLISLKLHAISHQQLKTKMLVLSEAKKYTNYHTTIAKICFIESSYGLNILGDDSRSLGIMQFKVSTARDMIRMCPKTLYWIKKISNRRLATILLEDKRLSIMLASLRFEYYRKKFGFRMAIMLHNGKWVIDKNGRAKRDKNNNKIVNYKYVKKVLNVSE